MKNKNKIIAALSIMSICGYVHAAPNYHTNSSLHSPDITGYLVDSEGHAVRVSDGSCVRTGSYDPATAYHPECNPRVAPPMPVVVTPVAPVQPVAAPIQQDKFARVTFKFDSYVLTPMAKERIDKLLSSSNAKQVKIEAGTDFMGTNRYNQRLSENRANAIANYITTKQTVEVVEINATGESKANLQNSEACKEVMNNRNQLIDCIEEDRVGIVTLIVQ